MSLILKEKRTLKLSASKKILESQTKGKIALGPELRLWTGKAYQTWYWLHWVFQGIWWCFISSKLKVYMIHSKKKTFTESHFCCSMKTHVLCLFISHSIWYIEDSHYYFLLMLWETIAFTQSILSSFSMILNLLWLDQSHLSTCLTPNLLPLFPLPNKACRWQGLCLFHLISLQHNWQGNRYTGST